MLKPPHFSTATESLGDVLRITLTGDIDGAAAPEFEKELVALLEGGATLIVIDFSGIHFVASAGLRVLLSFAKRIQKAGGKMVLSSLSPGVMAVFETVGFTTIFSIHPTHEDALREIGTP